MQPLHEALEEAVVLEIREVLLARVAAVVEGPNLECINKVGAHYTNSHSKLSELDYRGLRSINKTPHRQYIFEPYSIGFLRFEEKPGHGVS